MNKKEAKQEGIVKAEESAVAPIPLDLDKALALADAFAHSGMFPGITDKFQAMAIMEQGRILGLPAVISLGIMAPVKGRICIESKALAALAKKRGISIEIIKRDEKECSLKFSKEGEGEHTETFTMEDAKRAGLASKPNYMMYPKVMLHQRCLAFGLRVFDPGLALGLYTTEEIEELSPPKKAATGEVKDFKEEEKKKSKISFRKSKDKKPEEPKEKPKEEQKPEPEKEKTKEEEFEEKPEGEHAKEYEEVIAEIKKMLKTKGVDEKIFKQYLGEDLQNKKKREFVARNAGGHWSFHMGSMEDLKLLKENMDFVIDAYLESSVFKKAAKKKDPFE